jgi:hypothetical protein
MGPQSMIAMVVPEDARLPVSPQQGFQQIDAPVDYITRLVRTALRQQQTVRGLFRIAAAEGVGVPEAKPEVGIEATPAEPKLAMGVLNYCIDSRICGPDIAPTE